MKLANLLSARGLKKIALWTLSSLALFTVFGFFLLPLILKAVLTSQLSKKLHREVTIEKIQLNPFTLLAHIHGFMIKDRDGVTPFVSFEELSLDFQAASLFKRGPVVRDILLKTPHVAVVRNDNSYSIYRNGVLAAGPATDSSPDLPTSSTWFMGSRPTQNSFSGQLDDVRIWKRPALRSRPI